MFATHFNLDTHIYVTGHGLSVDGLDSSALYVICLVCLVGFDCFSVVLV